MSATLGECCNIPDLRPRHTICDPFDSRRRRRRRQLIITLFFPLNFYHFIIRESVYHYYCSQAGKKNRRGRYVITV
jgi:hypothetical protein